MINRTCLLLLLSAFAAFSAPLPPSPPSLVIKTPIAEPKVLRSPRDSSQPKSATMVKATTISSYPAGSTIWLTLQKDLNFFGCDTNDPGCVLYDAEQIEFLQLQGQGVQLEFADTLPSGGWHWVGQFYPPPQDTINGASFFYPNSQRPAARYYRVIPWSPDFSPAGRLTAREPNLNRGGFPSIRVWSSPRKR